MTYGARCYFAGSVFLVTMGDILLKNSKRLYLAALIPFALIVLLFELMPVAATVMRSFCAEGGGGFTLEHYSAILPHGARQQPLGVGLLVARGALRRLLGREGI